MAQTWISVLHNNYFSTSAVFGYMPASEPVELVDGLFATIEPLKEPDSIFFTRDKPIFELTLTNNSEYHFVKGSQMNWVIGVGQGMPEPIYLETLDVEIPKGESRTYKIGGKLLAFEGHGVIGVTSGGHSGKSDSDERTLTQSHGTTYNPAYTFSVWDEDHYSIIHEKPKQMMRWTMILSALVVILGLIQVAAIFG